MINNIYDKKEVEPYAKKMIIRHYDSSYTNFIKTETDNFDYISPDKKTGLEITIVLPENEIKAHEYSINLQKGKKNLNSKKIKECIIKDDKTISRYYGGSIGELFNKAVAIINRKNEIVGKRLKKQQAERAELCLCISDGGLFDNVTVSRFEDVLKETIFEKTFIITRGGFWVISKNDKANLLAIF